MATRFIGGMIAEGLPEIAGAVPAAGGGGASWRWTQR